jgi:hypothetical protein
MCQYLIIFYGARVRKQYDIVYWIHLSRDLKSELTLGWFSSVLLVFFNVHTVQKATGL